MLYYKQTMDDNKDIEKQLKRDVKSQKVYAARERERLFVKALQEGNKTQGEAVLEAGYKAKNKDVASRMGTELLQRPTVLALLHSNESKAEQVISDIMLDTEAMHRDRLAAAKLTLAYTQGNPISRNENVNVSVSLEDILRSDK